MGPPGSAPLGETLNRREKILVFGSLMIALFMAALDQMVVSTATPTILSDLGGFELLSWLFTSYMLASTVVVPLTGKLSDIFGRKPFLLGGIVVFMVGSVACGAAPNMESLIAFRVLQGIGGGMLFSSVFASVGDIVPPAERGRYIGVFTAVFSLASILGPSIGGLLTDHAGWRWIFYLNVPVGMVAMPAVWFNLPTRKATHRPRVDFMGALYLSISSVSLLTGLVWAGDDYAWSSVQVVTALAVAVVFLAIFLWQEVRHPEPIVPLQLFRNRVFLVSNLTVFALGMGMFGALAYLPTFVQTAMRTSATASGIITTPQSLGVLVASTIGGQLIARTGRYRWQTVFGAALVFGAMVLLTTLQADVERWRVSAYMVLLGMGFGLVLPTMSVVTQNAVPYRFLGVASSASQFFRQIGAVLGTAIFGTLLATSYQGAFDERVEGSPAGGIPAPIIQRFEDPTLALDKPGFASVQRAVQSLPNGQAMLVSAIDAQRDAVAVAIRRMFVAAALVAFMCLGFAFLLTEIPLRKDFKEVAAGPAPATTSPAAVPHVLQEAAGGRAGPAG